MTVRTRFAPSPTGFLHVGGARTALYNWLFARAHGGTFVLRIEDTDADRSTEASVQAILDGMRWLGLSWDEGPGVGGEYGPYFQTERRAHYERRATELLASGHAYHCWCTADELAARRAAQAERGEDPRYDGACRRLSEAEREAKRASGAPAALRFECPSEGESAWDDVVRGRVSFRNDVLDDFVLVRGDDHSSNTPRQLLIYAALGATPPVFAHASMILGPDGKRLSKRHGATSVEAFGELGIVPEGMVNFLALLGWAYDGKQELFSLDELAKVFTLEKVGANPAVFDTQKLEWVNGQHLKRLDETERVRRVKAFLASRGHAIDARGEEWCTVFVRALGERLRTLVDAETVGAFALSDTVTVDEEAFAAAAAKPGARAATEARANLVARAPEFSLASLEAATRALATERGMKAGELIGLARLALTGQKTSPGIFEVLWLVGRERAVERLRAAASRMPAGEPT